MKNNIILILVVTVISIGIIVASILISAGGNGAGGQEVPPPSHSGETLISTPGTDEPETRESVPSSDFPNGWGNGSEQVIPTEEPPVSSPSEVAQNVIATARSLIGIEFSDGGESPSTGFDNSGFIYYVLRENGYITCPRGVAAQSVMGTAVDIDKLQPGDLAFFYSDDMSSVGFGGIYCGSGKMIACLMPGTDVKEIDISSEYYRGHFYRGVGLN